MSTVLDDRRQALEEAFFRKENERLRSELRQTRERSEQKEALAKAAGLEDDDLLERLSDIGIGADTVAAMAVVPLVEVAWADGHMDAREIDAILRGAAECGIEAGSAAHELLKSWTREQPSDALMDAWQDYIRGVCGELSAEQRWRLEDCMVGRAQAVAAAAGGFLGIGKISGQEGSILEKLHSAFKD